MGRVSLLYCLFFLPLISFPGFVVSQQQWDASNFPDPTSRADFRRCGMRSQSLLCDPDSVLTEAQRYRINYELGQLEAKTRQENAPDFCQKKGITGGIAILRRIRSGSESATKALAEENRQKWALDRQCDKAISMVVVVDDMKFWTARGARVPVYGTEFTEIFKMQKGLFQSANYEQALLNMIRATWEKALEKKTPAPGDDRSFGPFQPKRKPEPSPAGKGRGGFPMPPLWLLVVIFFIVIPLLCCCCCIYFCCCRRKASSTGGGADGADPEYGRGQNRRQEGGSGGGLGRILGGIGGGAALNSIGQFIRGRAGQGQRDHQPVPTSDEGKSGQPSAATGGGLYPNVPVKDEGGGGSWK